MDERVRRTVAFLDASGYRSVSIENLASRVALGPSRLQHLFKHDTLLSIRDFVRVRRLEKAASLLVFTDDRVSEILYSVGFRDPSNFSHAFRKEFGMSPREYRARSRTIRSP